MSSPLDDMIKPTGCERESDRGKGGRTVAAVEDHPPGGLCDDDDDDDNVDDVVVAGVDDGGCGDCSWCLGGGEEADEDVLGLAGPVLPSFDAPLDLLGGVSVSAPGGGGYTPIV